MNYTLYTDGGSRGNPGPGAIGVVVFDGKGNKIKEISKYIGRCTNNEAEYTGLLEGLLFAQENNLKNLNVFMDSELIVNQLNGRYKVKNKKLKFFYDKITLLCKKFDFITFAHVKREENKVADSLVNKALDEYGK